MRRTMRWRLDVRRPGMDGATGRGLYLKRPKEAPVKGSPPEVKERVSEMLSRIEGEGMDAVRAYSRELDGWDPPSFRVSEEEIRRAADTVEPELREAIE